MRKKIVLSIVSLLIVMVIGLGTMLITNDGSKSQKSASMDVEIGGDPQQNDAVTTDDKDGKIDKKTHIPTGQTTGVEENLVFSNPDGKLGIMSFDGTILAEARWENISEYLGQYAIAKTNDTDHEIIDTKGTVLQDIDNTFECVDSCWYDNQYAIVKNNEKYGVIDSMGNMVIETKWDSISFAEDGNWIVESKGKYGVMGPDGTILSSVDWDSIDTTYDSVGIDGEQIFIGSKENEYGSKQKSFFAIDNLGTEKKKEIVLPADISDITSFRYGYAVFTSNGRRGLIDSNGTIVIDAAYDNISMYFSANGGFAVLEGRDYCNRVVNNKGNVLFESSSEIRLLNTCNNGYCIWGSPYSLTFITDIDNNILNNCSWYNAAYDDNTKCFLVATDYDTYGLIDEKGKYILQPVWSRLRTTNEDVFIVCIDKKYGLIDINGNSLSETRWSQVSDFSAGTAVVKITGGKYGLINSRGEYICEPKWDYIQGSGEGFYIVFSGSVQWANILNENDRPLKGIYGIMKNDGTMLMEAQMDYIFPSADGVFRFFQGTVDDENYMPKTGKYGYIKDDGTVISKLKWDNATDFSHGIAYVSEKKTNDKSYCGPINTKGELLFSSDSMWLGSLQPYAGDKVFVSGSSEYDRWTLYDLHGVALYDGVVGFDSILYSNERIVHYRFDEIFDDEEGRTAVLLQVKNYDSYSDNHYILIDSNFKKLNEFIDSIPMFIKDGKYYLLFADDTWYLYMLDQRIL